MCINILTGQKDIASCDKPVDIKNNQKYKLSCDIKTDGGEIWVNLLLTYWLEGDHNYWTTGIINYGETDKEAYTKIGIEWTKIEKIINVNEDAQIFFAQDLFYNLKMIVFGIIKTKRTGP